jgi:outer membrane protein TolC
MNGKETDVKSEQALVKMYMDLTGTTENGARAVFMYACPDQENTGTPGGSDSKPLATQEPAPTPNPGRTGKAALILLALCSLSFFTATAQAGPSFLATNSFPTQPLSLADAVNIALLQSPTILRAKRDVESAQGVSIQTRAIAIPKINATGGYNAFQKTDVDIITVPNSGLSLGNDQNWSTQVRVVQSLYEGGRILSSLRAARLTRQQSMLVYQTAVADVVLEIELAYFDVLLAAQQITVQEASVELLSQELADTTRRYDAGTVPRFNVLRAEVEVANARPRLIQARNSFRIGKHNLAVLLGFRVPKESPEDIPLTLSGKLEAEPYQLDLQRALGLALEQRTELGALRKGEALRQEDITTARAGYKPSLQIFAGYDGHNTTTNQDLGIVKYGWITGVQLSWNIFDGFASRGKVQQATALYEQAAIDLDETSRRIELEVRTAFSNLTEADEVLKSQLKVVEEAEEALRLATARNDAGTGTQLDVLSAQTALTDARSTQIQALHDFAAARARLERAVGAKPGGES